jgi:hypothetical protein
VEDFFQLTLMAAAQTDEVDAGKVTEKKLPE